MSDLYHWVSTETDAYGYGMLIESLYIVLCLVLFAAGLSLLVYTLFYTIRDWIEDRRWERAFRMSEEDYAREHKIRLELYRQDMEEAKCQGITRREAELHGHSSS